MLIVSNWPLARDQLLMDNEIRDALAPDIILASRWEAKFIDLGVNYLYSRQVGIAEHDDSAYVAPEVKNRGPSVTTADVYSLGIMITEMLAGFLPRDGRIPLTIYEISSVLGQVLEDLIEEDPTRRLLLLPAEEPFRYIDLKTLLDRTFESARNEPVASGSELKRQLTAFLPLSLEPKTQFDNWRRTRKENRPGDTYLLLFTMLASIVWWLIAARSAIPAVSDAVAALPHLPPAPSPAALIAFSQGAIAAKYYQTILARLSTRGISVRLARLTEFMMRAMVFVALPTPLIGLYWRPHLWAWPLAFGAAGVALCNLCTYLVARHLCEAGSNRGFSTVPTDDQVVARGYEQWWWTMLLYAFVIAVIATGLQTGYMKDEHAYVFGLLTINFGIHYLAKVALAGPSVEGSLARAFWIGHRIVLLDKRIAANSPTATTSASPPHSSPSAA